MPLNLNNFLSWIVPLPAGGGTFLFRQESTQRGGWGGVELIAPVAVPGIFVGANAFLICRPRPLAQVACSAPGSAPIAPPYVPLLRIFVGAGMPFCVVQNAYNMGKSYALITGKRKCRMGRIDLFSRVIAGREPKRRRGRIKRWRSVCRGRQGASLLCQAKVLPGTANGQGALAPTWQSTVDFRKVKGDL